MNRIKQNVIALIRKLFNQKDQFLHWNTIQENVKKGQMEGTQIYDTYICIDVSIALKLICKK